MKIEVHNIPSHGLDLAFEKRADSFPSLKRLMENGQCHFVTPIVFDLNVKPMRDFISVKGFFKTMVRQACVRCLVDFEHPLRSRFSLNFSKEIPKDLHHKDKEGIELTAQQIGIIYFEKDEIDFTEVTQEQVILSMPYNPICSKACKGLCHQCGQDLNKSKCQCRERKNDGPFAALKNLKLPPQ